MDLDTFQPTFLIQIERQAFSADITGEITSFVFEDNEEELDVMELSVSDRLMRFVDDPLFQEGNEIVARFGYVGNLSRRKKAVIKDIDYDFPENGAPRIRFKAYYKGFQLAGKENQKVWQKPAPGILYSEIAEAIAAANGFKPFVMPTVGRHLRVVQSNVSDARFLKDLAMKARATDGDGVTGYTFFVQDDGLHFHARTLTQAPATVLEYFTDRKGVLRSFRPSTQSQGAKGAGTQTKSVGVDPRQKAAVSHAADNETTPERTSLGKRTYLVDGNTGEAAYKEQESGRIVPSVERSEGFHEEPNQEPAQDLAEGTFAEAELRQVEAVALTIGIPSLRAKQNVEIKGVGTKFSGVYYCHSVRHVIDGSGYHSELKLRKNALGRGAGDKSVEVQGRPNEQEAPRVPREEPPEMVRIDADSGQRLEGVDHG